MSDITNLERLRELTTKLQDVEDITLQLKEIKDRFILLDSSINLMIFSLNARVKELTREITNGE